MTESFAAEVPGGSDDPFADGFADSVAPYLLGLLGEQERAAFADHATGCAACAGRLADLAPTTAALGRLTACDWASLDEPAPVPSAVLSRLVRAVTRHRLRVRAAVAASAAVAAGAVAALIVVLAAGSGGGAATGGVNAAGRPMTAVASAPVRATADLTATPWGTRISVTCWYTGSGAYPGGSDAYALQVVDTGGTRHRLGSWTQPGSTVRFTGGVALAENHIRAVQVVRPDGRAILSLTVQ